MGEIELARGEGGGNGPVLECKGWRWVLMRGKSTCSGNGLTTDDETERSVRLLTGLCIDQAVEKTWIL